MTDLPDPVTWAIPAFILMTLIEVGIARVRAPHRYEARDTLTSLLLGTGSTIAGVLTVGLVYAMATWVYQFRLFDIGMDWPRWCSSAPG